MTHIYAANLQIGNGQNDSYQYLAITYQATCTGSEKFYKIQWQTNVPLYDEYLISNYITVSLFIKLCLLNVLPTQIC